MAENQLDRVFSALADPVRRDIVERLSHGEATVNELAEPFSISLQAVSKHLKVLEGAGLITRSRDAQRRPCRLNTEALDLSAQWIERYQRRKEEQFERLDALLREHPEEEKSS
ncbi:MAG TPA: metalloregulator ArsR/SmtB family transcription factor [Thermomicrobiales bacterium]|nr:metalloregulator ArsR/SmtB family transcription factor [Thermomicrobiales bacterium]